MHHTLKDTKLFLDPRRLADEQESPPLGGRPRPRAPAARDPGRRRQVQARLDHGPDRPRGSLLPPLARDRGGGGPEPADPCLRERPRAPARGRLAAGGGRAAPAGVPSGRGGDSGGSGMTPRASALRATIGYDVEAVRRDFPILRTTVHGKPLVSLDSAASAPK